MTPLSNMNTENDMSPTLNPLTWFPGYKTYILALGTMAGALSAWLLGNMDFGTFVEAMVAASMAMTLRKGMK